MGSVLDDIGKIFEDVTGVVGDVVAAGASLFDGPGGVIGRIHQWSRAFRWRTWRPCARNRRWCRCH